MVIKDKYGDRQEDKKKDLTKKQKKRQKKKKKKGRFVFCATPVDILNELKKIL